MTNRHHLTPELIPIIRETLAPKYSGQISNLSYGGARLGDPMVDRIQGHISRLGMEEGIKVVVLVMGGNNLRPPPRGGNEEPNRVVARFARIIQFASHYPNIKLVISGLVPHIGLPVKYRERFIQCSKDLRSLCRASANATFFNPARFLTRKGQPIAEFWADDVHLSPLGAELRNAGDGKFPREFPRKFPGKFS